jgi:hypothetical protein
VSPFEGMTRAAPHGREILVVHFDQLIEWISSASTKKQASIACRLAGANRFSA